MKKISLLFIVFIALINDINAQVGGKNIFKFLSIPNSARATAQGGSFNSIYDNDVSLAVQNPAILNPSMTKQMSMNYMIYYAGINYGNFNYVHDFKPATFQFGATYMNYGKLPRYDIYGNQVGLMTANEVSLNAGAGKSYKDKYKFGANAKFIYSQLGTAEGSAFNSVGLAFDMAAMIVDTAHLLNFSFNVTNLGFQFKTFRKANQEFLPLDIQLSISKRLKHVPFRFILTAHHLYAWDVRYDNPNIQQNSTLFGDEPKETKPAVKVIDNIARHFTLGGEIYIGKIITLDIAYNHMRRAELTIPSANGLAGLSFGFGLKVKRFTLYYGLAKYALPQSVNHLTLNVNLGEGVKFKKRKINN